jgi:hypothetical protein
VGLWAISTRNCTGGKSATRRSFGAAGDSFVGAPSWNRSSGLR